MLLISLVMFSVGWMGAVGGMTTGGVVGLSSGWGWVSTVVFSLFSDDVFWGGSAGLLSAVVLSDGSAGLFSAGLLPFSGTVGVGFVEGVCPLLPQADKAKAMIRAGHTRVNNEFIIVSYLRWFPHVRTVAEVIISFQYYFAKWIGRGVTCDEGTNDTSKVV
jgi:hypothetical protein